MALDIFKTHHLLAAVRELTPAKTFLRDRYFPTNDVTDLFATDDVLVEYKAGNKKVAPFVSPRKKGITILREGSYMERYTPPLVAPSRLLTVDELKKRGFGESLMSEMTPEERQQMLMMQDVDELSEMISRREELMASEILMTNKCIMKHYADDMKTVVEEKEIKFYEGESDPAEYTPSAKWSATGVKIIDDIYAMVSMLADKGLPATDLVVGAAVAAIIMNDKTVKELLDIRNYNIGMMEPIELTPGVSRMCVLNVYGREISVFSYNETYTADDGTDKPIIPEGKVAMTAPEAGRTMYGAITQIEQADGEFHTYAGRRVPKYISDPYTDTRSLTLSSAPLLIPNHINPWVTATVL